jgi:hypothetical protein
MQRYIRWAVALIWLFLLPNQVLGGTWTNHGFIYKPAEGARGATEKNTFDAGLDRVDARLGKEIWVGDPNYGTTLQDAITAIGSNQTTLRLPAGSYSIDTDTTIPANITLKPERGAILSIATTKTLTINGGLEAGLYQIFSCSGTGKVVYGTGVQEVFPEWYGAKGDNSTDDAGSINQAAVSCRASSLGITLRFTSGSSYWVTNQLDLTGIKFIKMNRYHGIRGSNAGVLVKVGYNSSVALGEGVRWELSVLRERDWTAGNTNIQILGMDTGYAFIEAMGGNIGCEIYSDATTGPFTCNEIDLGDFSDNATDLHFTKSTGGFCNETNLYKGRFSNGLASDHGVSAIAAIWCDGTGSRLTFYSPDFERTYGINGAIFDNVSYNNVKNARVEGSTTAPNTVAQFKNGAYSNKFEIGCNAAYNLDVRWTYDSEQPGSFDNVVVDSRAKPLVELNRRLIDGSFIKNCYNDTNGNFHCPGLLLLNLNQNKFASFSPTTVSWAVEENALVHQGTNPVFALGVILDLNHKLLSQPVFYGWYRPAAGNTAAIWVKCYDANKAELYSNNSPYVFGSACYPSDTYKGYEVTSPALTGEKPGATFTIHPDVKYVFIGIKAQNGNAPVIESFDLYTNDPGARVLYDYTGWPDYNNTLTNLELPGRLLSGVPPNQPIFPRGAVVWNKGASTGSALGWQNIAANVTTLSQAASQGDYTIHVNSTTSMVNTAIIAISLDSGRQFYTTVNGDPSGDAVPLTDAIPSAASVGQPVKVNYWKALPNLP